MSVVTGQAAPGVQNKASELKQRFLALVMIMFNGDVQAMRAHTTRLEQGDGGSKRVVKVLASIAIGVVILNQIFQIDSIANSTGPFAGVIDTLETVGSAALVLLVVGLVAYGGAIALSYMDMF
jgi:hypothetical protein